MQSTAPATMTPNGGVFHTSVGVILLLPHLVNWQRTTMDGSACSCMWVIVVQVQSLYDCKVLLSRDCQDTASAHEHADHMPSRSVHSLASRLSSLSGCVCKLSTHPSAAKGASTALQSDSVPATTCVSHRRRAKPSAPGYFFGCLQPRAAVSGAQLSQQHLLMLEDEHDA